MNPTESNPPANEPSDKLNWTRFEWEAKSNETTIVGYVTFCKRPTLLELNREINRRIAQKLVTEHEPWDPFNCTLVVRRVEGLLDFILL